MILKDPILQHWPGRTFSSTTILRSYDADRQAAEWNCAAMYDKLGYDNGQRSAFVEIMECLAYVFASLRSSSYMKLPYKIPGTK